MIANAFPFSIFPGINKYTLIVVVPVSLLILGLRLYRDFRLRNELSNFTILPTEELIEEERIYEIGQIVNGDFSFNDLVATIAVKRINNIEFKDEVENIIQSYEKKTLFDILLVNEQAPDKEDLYLEFANILVEEGLFKYNPYKFLNRELQYISPLMFLILIYGYLSTTGDKVNFAENIFLGVSWGIVFVIALIKIGAFFLHENYIKTAPKKAKILGLRMYLKTTEYYKVRHDEKSFKKYLPFLISLGVHFDHIDEMIEYVDEHHPVVH